MYAVLCSAPNSWGLDFLGSLGLFLTGLWNWSVERWHRTKNIRVPQTECVNSKQVVGDFRIRILQCQTRVRFRPMIKQLGRYRAIRSDGDGHSGDRFTINKTSNPKKEYNYHYFNICRYSGQQARLIKATCVASCFVVGNKAKLEREPGTRRMRRRRTMNVTYRFLGS